MSNRFALIIGNSEYEDATLAKLKTPEADAHALAATLRDPQIGGFDDVQELLNQDEGSIRRAISAFFTEKKPDDMLLLYFSGHGVLDPQGRLFLAVKNTQRSLLKATAIPASFVSENMDDCRSKRQVLILDCCHSGAFARGTKGEAPAVTRDTFAGSGYGRVVLTASDSTQYALEGDQVIEQASLSLFTHYLLEGLTSGEADTELDGWITLDEWYDYAYERVRGETPAQTPRKWVYNQQGDLVIAKNPRSAQVKPAELPERLRARMRSDYKPDRLEAIQELQGLLQSEDPAMMMAAQAALEQIAAGDDSLSIQKSAAEVLAQHIERLRLEQVEQERLAKERAVEERLRGEKAEAERLVKEKAEAERLAWEKAEAKRLAREKAEQERLRGEQNERERRVREQAEAERLVREKAEQERKAKEQAQAERVAREKAERERRARELQERENRAREQAEAERLVREKAEQERLLRAQEEREHPAKPKAEAEREKAGQAVSPITHLLDKLRSQPKPRIMLVSWALALTAIGIFAVISLYSQPPAPTQTGSQPTDAPPAEAPPAETTQTGSQPTQVPPAEAPPAVFECTDAIGCVDVAAGDPIHIAYLLVVAGPDETLGIDSRNGVEIAIEDSGSKIAGHDVKFDGEDGGCFAEGGQAAGTKLAADPSIVAIIGTSCSSEARVAVPLLSQAGFVIVSPSNVAPDLTEAGNPNNHPGYLRTSQNDKVQGASAAKFAYEELKVTKAASIQDSSVYADKLQQMFVEQFKKMGGTITAQETVDPNQTDMSAVLTSIAAGRPELIYFPIFQPAGIFIIRQAKQIPGLENTKLMGADGLFSPYVTDAAGDDVEGFYVSSPLAGTGAAYDAFVARYQKKFGTVPTSIYHAHAYDAYMMIKAAIEKVAVQDADGALHIPRKALRDAMYATKDFNGITGNLTCTPTGDCGAGQIGVYQYHKGQYPPDKIWP